ncbi:MAG: PIN domain-containing protein [Acidimicrobiaceae bacterium]|nr:PIN domain-containing protein [Acidimicrobiaceae bacterium]MYB87827.1 PIN domain-containing protein [Acidimicrobiaceae bacterium]MYH94239.1 PIN domain-containing protein [Acidimicrobiaceae bacterium]
MIVDTSLLLAAFVPDQRMHAECAQVLRTVRPLVLSPLVLAELDYLTARIAGVDAELALLAELSSGAYELASFGLDDLTRARSVVERYQDLPLGLTDASLVVLADRYDTDTIGTLDERHFRVVRSLSGRPLRILPADTDPDR